jgi:hypothetical protein
VSGWVYLIDDGAYSYKIGYARDPEKRLKLLQCGHPDQLRIAAVVEGTKRTERELHELFSGDRLRGEWFRKSREIDGYFEEHGFNCVCGKGVDAECFIHGEGPPW